jgi:hypothetical protein
VEADECYQSAGSKGLPREVERYERAPRQRGIQLRGRATAETGRPPILGLVQRRDKADQDAPAAQVYLEVLENVRTATIKPIIVAKVKSGSQFFTDEYNILTGCEFSAVQELLVVATEEGNRSIREWCGQKNAEASGAQPGTKCR